MRSFRQALFCCKDTLDFSVMLLTTQNLPVCSPQSEQGSGDCRGWLQLPPTQEPLQKRARMEPTSTTTSYRGNSLVRLMLSVAGKQACSLLQGTACMQVIMLRLNMH